jgi:quercetin dioxygenase-like cupin family protein
MEGTYKAEKRETIAEAPGLRVRRITLAPGDAVPWHHHTAITDTFFCMQGTVIIETRAPAATHVLQPGEGFAVPPKRAHTVHGNHMGRCQFMVIQGVGDYDFVPADGD